MKEKPLEKVLDPVPQIPAAKPKSVIPGILITILGVVSISSIAAYFLIKSSTLIPQQTQIVAELTTVPTLAPDPSGGWNTYANTKYEFSVAYPSDWSVREYPDSKDGAAFSPIGSPGYPDESDAVSISAGQKAENPDVSFEEYVKVAASNEIQDYDKLASIKSVTTGDGKVGYETTWMVQPFLGRGDGPSESLPIAYFELPNRRNVLVRVYLNRKEDLDIYEKMLKTIKFTASADATPEPTVDEAEVLRYVMKKYITLKHGGDSNSLTISVSNIEGNFAKGMVSDEGGGGMWFAAKEDGAWLLVWDGNGIIQCSVFTLYPDFPKSMIPSCFDEIKQDVVKR